MQQTPTLIRRKHRHDIASDSKSELFNWDVIGVASVATTIAGAALFFISGWVYEAHWYSYFGIDASQMSIQPQMTMARGMWGILYLTLATAIGMFIYFLIDLIDINPAGRLARISSAFSGSRLILIVLALLYMLLQLYAITEFPQSTASISNEATLFTAIGYVFAILVIMAGIAMAKNKSGSHLQFILFLSALFFFALSMSAIRGATDATKGIRVLSGNWQLPITFIHSDYQIPILTAYEHPNTTTGYVYGPLSLITRDENSLYLAESKQTEVYDHRPKLFVISRNDEQDYSLEQMDSTQ